MRAHLLLSRGGGRSRQQPVAVALFLSTVALAIAGCGESSSGSHTSSADSAATSASVTSTSTATTNTGSSSSSSAQTPAKATTPGRTTANPAVAGHRARGHTAVLAPRGSHPAPKPSSAERSALPPGDITLTSSGIARTARLGASTIARRYTCQGANESPPLQWSGVPAGTSELALFVIASKPVAHKLAYAWAVAGISPTITGTPAGQTPAGAIVGRNNTGQERYSLCPDGGPETYVFIIFALPHSLSPKPGFEPAALRAQALAISRHTGLLVGSYG
jgi:phosphatidylethanolamine-binding protein (PEBP) family uncharacterized protein